MSGELDANRADARVADAAAERRRLRSAQHRGSRQMSMREVVVGLAEQDAEVSLMVGAGRSHRVRLTAVSAEVVVATTEAGRLLVIGTDAIRGVVTHRGGAGAGRGRDGGNADGSAYGATGSSWHMADIFAHWLDEHPRITTWCGTEQLSGTLIAVGQDLATMTLEGSGGTAYVRLDSTTEISLSVSSSL
jgi:hypothetical protein